MALATSVERSLELEEVAEDPEGAAPHFEGAHRNFVWPTALPVVSQISFSSGLDAPALAVRRDTFWNTI